MSSKKKNADAPIFDDAAAKEARHARALLSVPDRMRLDDQLRSDIEDGDVSGAIDALIKGASASASERCRQSALSLAASSLNGDRLITALILAGAKVNDVDSTGETALVAAAQSGYKGDKSVWRLLALGADPNAGRAELDKKSCLHIACEDNRSRDTLVEALLLAGADPKALDRRRFTPLHYAALNGFDLICKDLLHYGADVHALTINGNTPLHKAAEASKDRVIELLISYGAAFDAINSSGETPLARQVDRSKSMPQIDAKRSQARLRRLEQIIEERLALDSSVAPAAPLRARGQRGL